MVLKFQNYTTVYSFKTTKLSNDNLSMIGDTRVDRGSSVGIASRYGLDDSRIESLPIPVAAQSKA